MAGIAGGALAAAVTRAGGLGFIGGGYGDVAWIEHQLDVAGGADVGVGLITWALRGRPNVVEHLVRRGVRWMWLSFGDPAPHIAVLHQFGAVALCQVQTVAEARHAVAAGADVIVAQGHESGGHGRNSAPLAELLPAVTAAVAPIPVLGAGGMTTSVDRQTAVALGAAGVVVGTRLYASDEALDTDAAKARLVASTATRRTNVFDLVRGPMWPAGYTGRAIVNATVERWHGCEDALRANLDAARRDYRRAVASDDTDGRVVWAGTGLSRIQELLPAGAIVRAIARSA
jgi:nitronate monooxygenase